MSRALGKVDGTSDLLKSDNAAEAEEPVRDGEAVDAESAVPERPADTRTPIQRFRTYPRKPLTVTDLAAGAWCELQYLYTLTRLPGGRRTRTPAMIQGSKIHERLELETHGEAVQVDVVTKEDAFGLKLWNLVQALRTLRDTGLTREVEVWGMVEDNLVNGVIDVLSYESPDPEFEEEVLSSQRYSGREGQDEGDAALDVNRSRKITDFFVPVDAFRTSAYSSASTSTRKAGSDDADEQSKRLAAHLAPKVYIKDIKTRASERKPNGAALRPTKIQLFLYHKFLGEMASGQLDFLRVFRRYGLDPDASFSDGFLAQIGELHDEVFFDSRSRVAANSISTDARSRSDSQSTVSGLIASTPGSFPIEKPERPTSTRQSAAPAPDQILDLVRYPTLRSLLSLVTSELRETFPLGAASLGTLLTVEYRMRNSDPPGRVIGEWHFPFDGARLGDYLSDYMKWWLGERRAARGVDVEESYKCRICEFAEDCEWRRKMEAKLSRGNGMGSVGAAEHGSRAGSSKGEHANEV